MKKTILTFIFLLPLFLFACEQEQIQTEPSELEKRIALKNHFNKNSMSHNDFQIEYENASTELQIKAMSLILQLQDGLVGRRVRISEHSGGSDFKNGKFCYLFTEIQYIKLTNEACWKVDNNLNTFPLNTPALRVESCLFKGWCLSIAQEEE